MKEKNKLTTAGIAAALRSVFDPETGINIVDMGLVYQVVPGDDAILLTITYSTPACPMGEAIERDIRDRLQEAFGDVRVEITVTFQPMWHPDMLSRAALESF